MPDMNVDKKGSRGMQTAPRSLSSGLYHYGSIGEFRKAAALPPDTQLLIDRTVERVRRQRLVLVEDLLAEGLTYNLPNWLSVMELGWDSGNDVGHAQRTMIPKARGERQVADQRRRVIPIYATWDDFSFQIRELMASERVGSPLETTHVEMATRRVNEAIEDQAWNGAGIAVKGNTAPGVLTHSNVNTETYTSNRAWDNASHTGENILTDVLNMIDAAQADLYYGPYNLYIPTTYGSKLNQDFKANGSLTIRQRLEELVVGGRNLRIRVADQLPANRTVLMQMTSDVVDVIVGQTPTTISWEDGPGWERSFVVLACMIVRVKADYNDRSGIVLGYPT